MKLIQNTIDSLLQKYPQLEVLAPDAIIDRVSQMNRREQAMVIGATACIILFFLYFIFSSGFSKINVLERRVRSTRGILKQVKNISAQVTGSGSFNQGLMSRIKPASGFYLASYIESQEQRFRMTFDQIGAETRQQLGENIEEISINKISTKKIPFRKMLTLISELENSKESLLRIQNLRIQSIPNDPINVELSFKLSAYVKK